MRWRRVVLDEAHYIKGRTTQAAQAVFALHAECRWAVTGERPSRQNSRKNSLRAWRRAACPRRPCTRCMALRKPPWR
jgi:hypothetical protein